MNGSTGSSHNNVDLSTLSKEQLIALLRQRDAVIKEKERENAKLKIIAAAHNTTLTLALEQMENIRRTAAEVHGMDTYLADAPSADLSKLILLLSEELLRWIATSKTWLGFTPFVTGNESLKPADKNKLLPDVIKEETQQALKAAASLQNSRRALSRTSQNLKHIIIDYVDLCRKNGYPVNPTVETAYAVIMQDTAPKPNPERKPSPGRTGKNRFGAGKTVHSSGQGVCRHCGSRDFGPTLGQIKEKLLCDCRNRIKVLEAVTVTHDAAFCSKCGKLHVFADRKHGHPAVPNHNTDCLTVLHCADAVYHGIPLNRFAAGLKQYYELGHETLERELHLFTEIYLKPLYEQIVKEAASQPVLLCDETPFRTLEAQGLGFRGKEQSAATDDEASAVYIAAVGSSPSAEKQCALYSMIRGRSTEQIAKLLSRFTACGTLVSDGYAAYSSVCEERKLQHQSCLIHLRREVLKALDIKSYEEKYRDLSDEELTALLKPKAANADPAIAFMFIMEALGQIYSLEGCVDYRKRNKSNLERIMQIRGKQRVLLEHIDTLFNEVAKGKVKQNLKGGYQSLNKNDPYAKACVYYLNRKDNFKVFLDAADVPPDTNIAEREIRPLTLLRKNINHKNSLEGMNDLTVIYTVMRTLELNGHEPVEFLRNYCHELYYYCFEKGWDEALKEGKSLDKKILTWDMRSLSAGFNFESFSPF